MSENIEWHDNNEMVRKLDVVEAVLMCDDLEDVVDCIMNVPMVEPKQGEWICEVTKSQARDRWVIERVVLYCSECNGEAGKMTKFCPNCGARMEGVDDDAD